MENSIGKSDKLLGNELKGPGDEFNLELGKEYYTAIIGALNKDNFSFILNNLKEQNLINIEGRDEILSLTFTGWQEYERLQGNQVESRKAFMAMPFKDRYFSILFPCYKAAVSKTGFRLVHLGENKETGLIDNKLRVEIRSCRFIIAELTEGNHGAYWESGFAEGLGRPVIYSCEKKYFDEHKTHFDTNHLHTIIWEEDKLEKAEEDLKATIRATIPDEAVLEDTE